MSSEAAMPVLSREERRRLQPLALDVPLIVGGESLQNEIFREDVLTISVSPDRVFVVLATRVALGQKVFWRDLKSQNETKRRIVPFGADYAGLTQVGIEFVRPASKSWLVTSLLDGWKSVSA
jgi:hypothetical protein